MVTPEKPQALNRFESDEWGCREVSEAEPDWQGGATAALEGKADSSHLIGAQQG